MAKSTSRGQSLVSVVIPAFNSERHIGGALASVLSQSYDQIEVVVVDDGSSDATPAIVAAHKDPRVKLIRQTNRGVAAARNRGIRASRGDAIAFCDADDIWFEEHLRLLMALHQRTGNVATANSYWLFPGGLRWRKTKYRGRFPRPNEQRLAILQQNFVSTMSLVPRDVFKRVGLFTEALRYAEDWEFWLRAIFAGYRVSLQRQPTALWRWGTGLSSHYDLMDRHVDEVLTSFREEGELLPEEKAYVERRLKFGNPRVLVRMAENELASRSYSTAAWHMRTAARLMPSERPLVWKARALAVSPRVVGATLRRLHAARTTSLGLGPQHVR